MGNGFGTELTPQSLLHLRELLDRALDYPADRSKLLADVRAKDPVMARHLERAIEEHDRAERPVESFPDFLSRKIGGYRLDRELGRGGMGTVFLAYDEDSRRVALKLVRRSFLDPSAQQAFHRERKTLASLDHPGIAKLLDWGGLRGGLLYLVLEYVDGVAVTQYCALHRLPVTARLELFQQICAAAQHAHSKKIIHRDLKPPNILVTSQGRVKLLDFGIATMFGAHAPTAGDPLIYFTPSYASPEQLRGAPPAVSDDIYALGILLHEMLTGSLRMASPPIGSGFDAIVSKAIDKEPNARYQSVNELSVAIADLSS